MPPIQFERRTVRQIADQFERVAVQLRSWPTGRSASARGVDPSRSILTAMRRVNARLATGAKGGTIRPAAFRAMSGDFTRIAAALQKAARSGAAKRTTRRGSASTSKGRGR